MSCQRLQLRSKRPLLALCVRSTCMCNWTVELTFPLAHRDRGNREEAEVT